MLHVSSVFYKASSNSKRLSSRVPAPTTPDDAFAFPQSKRQRKSTDSRAFHKKQATKLIDDLSDKTKVDAPPLRNLKIDEPENVTTVKVGRPIAKSQAHPKEKEDVYTSVLETWSLSDLYAVIDAPLFQKLSSDHATMSPEDWKILVDSIPLELRKIAKLPEDTTDYTVDASNTKEEAKLITTLFQQCKDAWVKNVSRIVPHTGQCTCKNINAILFSSYP